MILTYKFLALLTSILCLCKGMIYRFSIRMFANIAILDIYFSFRYLLLWCLLYFLIYKKFFRDLNLIIIYQDYLFYFLFHLLWRRFLFLFNIHRWFLIDYNRSCFHSLCGWFWFWLFLFFLCFLFLLDYTIFLIPFHLYKILLESNLR